MTKEQNYEKFIADISIKCSLFIQCIQKRPVHALKQHLFFRQEEAWIHLENKTKLKL